MSASTLLVMLLILFFFNDTATTEIYTLSLHDALPIFQHLLLGDVSEDPQFRLRVVGGDQAGSRLGDEAAPRSEEHTSELQSRLHLVCRLLLEKKKKSSIFKTADTGFARR